MEIRSGCRSMILFFVLGFAFLSFGQPPWRIVTFELEGDTIFRVKYRTDYIGDTGVVRQIMKIKFKGKNIRAVDTTFRKIIIIPESEVEQ
jgi:hypothetical protein